jgi:hypothetical protein
MAEDYRFIFEKMGELVKDSHKALFRKSELLEIYSMRDEIENFRENYLAKCLTENSIPNLEENLENHINATFNYYDALIEKRILLKVFKELTPQNVSRKYDENLEILFGNIENEICEIRDSLSLATTDSFLLELLRNINNS